MYAEIGDWLADENRHETSAVLIGIAGTSSDDPELATDLRSLTREHPQLPVIVMGDSEDPSEVLEILFHGARGYIPTSVSLSVAIGALSLAIAGGVFVPASALLDTGHTPRQLPESRTVFGLTERQAAVAEAIARGTPNKIIAYELNLSESTVKVHTRSIMRKLQARNRTEVAFKLHATRDGPEVGRSAGLGKPAGPSSRRAPAGAAPVALGRVFAALADGIGRFADIAIEATIPR